MSHTLTKSPEHYIKDELNVDKFYKRLFYAFSTVLFSVLLLILLIWLTLHPSKPKFYLKEAVIYQLNFSGPHLLYSSVQITLVSKNPNKKTGVYYDQLGVCASYKGRQITVDTSLPPFYQGHEDSNLLAASLIGTGLPVAPSLGNEVGRDQTIGKLILSLKVNGQLRWKVGTWVSRRYRFNVNCLAIFPFGPNVVPGPLMSSKQEIQCSTTV